MVTSWQPLRHILCYWRDDKDSVCPLLRAVMEKGNITTYEWRTGRAPSSVVETASYSQALLDTDDSPQDQSADEVRADRSYSIDNYMFCSYFFKFIMHINISRPQIVSMCGLLCATNYQLC